MRHAERREAANHTKEPFCLSQNGGARGDFAILAAARADHNLPRLDHTKCPLL